MQTILPCTHAIMRYLILFGASKERVDIHIGDAQIEEIDEEKLLGISRDKKSSFKNHVRKLVKSFMLLRAFQSTWSPRN